MRREILRMENIISYSGGVRILNHARLNLFEDEILGVVGLNYSGKSALVGGFNGHFPYTGGTTYYLEEKLRITSVREARERGIFYIEPKSNLIPGFTVAENIFLREQGNKNFFCNERRYRREAARILKELKTDLVPDALVADITYSQRVMVEICVALAGHARIVIFDCVLSAMAKYQSDLFPDIFRLLRERHISVILIEPGLGPIKQFCDRLFVIRKGCTAGELSKGEIEENKVISLMIGYAIGEGSQSFANHHSDTEDVILKFDDVYAGNTLKGVSFDAYRNEITGILNFNKNSGAIIQSLLCGDQQPESGCIMMNGREIYLKDTTEALRNHIAVVSEEDSLCDEMSLKDNIIMSAIVKKKGRAGFFREEDYKYIKNQVIEEYLAGHSKEEEEAVPAGWFLRKKVAFLRAAATEPRLMVVVNPTQYIDMVSKKEIYADIMSLKKKNISVIVVSADIEEIIFMCDRMIVVQQGRVIDSFEIDKAHMKLIIHKYGEFLKTL